MSSKLDRVFTERKLDHDQIKKLDSKLAQFSIGQRQNETKISKHEAQIIELNSNVETIFQDQAEILEINSKLDQVFTDQKQDHDQIMELDSKLFKFNKD